MDTDGRDERISNPFIPPIRVHPYFVARWKIK